MCVIQGLPIDTNIDILQLTVMMGKRRHERFPLAASAAIEYGSKKGTEQMQALIADISLSGIGIYSDRRIRAGTRLSIDVTFISPEGRLTTVSVQGKSIYARKVGNMFFIGVEFDETMTSAKRPSLKRSRSRDPELGQLRIRRN